jgi:hypothetical protein
MGVFTSADRTAGRDEDAADSPASSAPVRPVTNDRYPGTSGRTHGLRKETAPAAKAIGAARIRDPEITVSAALI